MIFEFDIEQTLERLLEQEDTDGDKKITVEDKGPKSFTVFYNEKSYKIKGTYHLSNLLQELVIQKLEGKAIAKIPLKKIEELPTDRISRMIKEYYWNGLTRTMDKSGIKRLTSDTKNKSLTSDVLPVYVPFKDDIAYKYYTDLEKTLPIKTIRLPENITPEYVKSINKSPGILSLRLEQKEKEVVGIPFVVPGGRFNEMYGWDSYFEAVGLMVDGKVTLAKSMADHFQYQIEHYGKILNANRSYYLTRTQPPFYSSLIREVYEVTKNKNWLKSHLETAIKAYETIWMVDGKRKTENGLNRYLAEGIGIPPETEEGHFDAIIEPFANKKGLTITEYIEAYDNGSIQNPLLDLYFLHDRSVRESGHDTSYRLDGNCADLNLVDLNCMLYKYETDFAELIQNEFDDLFAMGDQTLTGNYWMKKAKIRRELVDQYLWNAIKGMYFDYDTKLQKRSDFIAATTLLPLWCKLASKEQATQLVKNAIPQLLQQGGIAGSTQKSIGEISEKRPQRQWDYPNGWAPHQMMIWKGLLNYEYENLAQELIYRWLYMITRNAVDYNGTIPEKYDVVAATHKVFAEYGNVGTDFSYITREGFGWMNASYQYGLSLLQKEYRSLLDKLEHPDHVF
ncbi:MAG: trehalase [Flavobacteriaceae bacterium]|nr:MAG: trehalase [Flavobacteriaceae bacterium]